MEQELELKKNLEANLFSIKSKLKEHHMIENTFVEIFGNRYLLDFDENDFELEHSLILFCRNNNIRVIKTPISYIFSLKPLTFKRKHDKVLI